MLVLRYPPRERVPVAAMLQCWCDLTFIHWPYPRSAVQKLVPAPLEVETFDGSAWVAVTPFMVRDLRPPVLPALPWISEFPETNCRTYVKGPDGRSGVWFFSLDAGRLPAVLGARLGYGLPYAWSKMRVTRKGAQLFYESMRVWPNKRGKSHILVEEGPEIRAGALEDFLTARFRLYSFILGKLTYTSVEHPPWHLNSAYAPVLEETLTAAVGLPEPEGQPLVYTSPGVLVRVARPKMITVPKASGRSDPSPPKTERAR